MSRIIIVDFRDDEDFGQHPYISYLKQTLNMTNYLEQIPELWKLNDFFAECVSDYLQIKRFKHPKEAYRNEKNEKEAIKEAKKKAKTKKE